MSNALSIHSSISVQAAALAFLRVSKLKASQLITLIEASEALPNLQAFKNATLATLWEEAPYIDFAGLGLLPPEQAADLRRLWPSINPQQELAPYLKAGVNLLLWGDAAYPALLAESHRPPACLFYKGNLKALSASTNVAIVGTRQASDLGRASTHRLIEGLRGQNLCIVSGLAEGIDSEAHQAALNAGLPTVAVYGCGLSQTYPARNKALADAIVEAGGTLLSEFFLEEGPNAKHFPQRNRIVVGLSQVVVVIEAARKSGAMISAQMGLDENRSVCAVPWHPSHELGAGPLSLIYDGAPPVWESQHLLDMLNSKTATGHSRKKQQKEAKTQANLKTPQTKFLAPEEMTKQVSLALMPSLPEEEVVNPSTATKSPTLTLESYISQHPVESVEAQILRTLGHQTLTLDEIANALKQDISQIMVALTMLSIEGHIDELSGARVRVHF